RLMSISQMGEPPHPHRPRRKRFRFVRHPIVYSSQTCRVTSLSSAEDLLASREGNVTRYWQGHSEAGDGPDQMALKGLTILNFHQLCFEIGEKAELPLPQPDPHGPVPPRDYFEEMLPQVLEVALDKFPEERFDAIVVDEGQAFSASWWLPLQLALSD